jgi:hypothetical protein
MNQPITGGCACDAIRYECTAEPFIMLNCHCRDCQRASGGAFASGALVPQDSFKFTKGEPRYYLTLSDAGGRHKRGFCPQCGSRLTAAENPEANKGFIGIAAASLDDPSWFKPEMDIWTADAQPWDQMDPKLPKYDKYPPPPRRVK